MLTEYNRFSYSAFSVVTFFKHSQTGFIMTVKVQKIEAGKYFYTGQIEGSHTKETVSIKKAGKVWTIEVKVSGLDQVVIDTHEESTLKACKELIETMLEQGHISLNRKKRLAEKKTGKVIEKQVVNGKAIVVTERPKPLYKTNSYSVGAYHQKKVVNRKAVDMPDRRLFDNAFAQLIQVKQKGTCVSCKPGYHYQIKLGTSDRHEKVSTCKLSDFPKHEKVNIVDNATGKITGYIQV